jgi:hypothetical protein
MAAFLEPVAGVGVGDRNREQQKAKREQDKIEHERLPSTSDARSVKRCKIKKRCESHSPHIKMT